MAKKIEKALVFKLPKIIKPYVTNNQTMCSFTEPAKAMPFCGFERERAEGGGLFFVTNEVCEKKIRRPVICE